MRWRATLATVVATATLGARAQVIHRYSHSDGGCSIVGGGFTDGLDWIPDQFLFSDWCQKGTRYFGDLDNSVSDSEVRTLINGMDGLMDTLVINNELYLMTRGRLYKLESTRPRSTTTATPTPTPTPTTTLTSTVIPTQTTTQTTTQTPIPTPTETPREEDLVIITGPDNGTLYKGGDTFKFQASESILWTVRFHHDTHFHPFITEQPGDVLEFTIPQGGEQSTNVWFRVIPIRENTELVDTILVPRIRTIVAEGPDGSQLIVYNQDTYDLPTEFRHIVGMNARFEVTSVTQPIQVNIQGLDPDNVFTENPWGFEIPDQDLMMTITIPDKEPKEPKKEPLDLPVCSVRWTLEDFQDEERFNRGESRLGKQITIHDLYVIINNNEARFEYTNTHDAYYKIQIAEHKKCYNPTETGHKYINIEIRGEQGGQEVYLGFIKRSRDCIRDRHMKLLPINVTKDWETIKISLDEYKFDNKRLSLLKLKAIGTGVLYIKRVYFSMT